MNTAMLSTLWAVIHKELLDISRDRRTLMLALLMGPLLAPLLIVGMNTLGEKRAKTESEKVLEVPIVGAARAPNLVAFLATQGIKAIAPPVDLDAAIARQDIDVALAIAADYAKDWRAGQPAKVEVISDTTRQQAQIPTGRVRVALAGYSDQVGALRLMARGIDPATMRAVSVGTRDLATPDAKRSFLLSFMLPYLLIMSAFVGGAYLILDATAGERERQSLEPLLATPAPRGTIVSGKIISACVLGLLSLLLTLLAFKLSAQFDSGSMSMEVSFAAIGKLLLILLPMVFIGTSLLTYLAASAKSMKEAQSHMTWLMLIPMLPSVLLMVNPVKNQLWQFAVPFLSQNQLIQKVVRGEWIDGQTWAVYLAAGFGLSALLWLAAVRRYHQEKLAISG